MYEKFGEFDSADEINQAAVRLKNEGKLDEIKALSFENGIDTSMAEMFIDGEVNVICDEETAAVGKIDMEIADVKAEELMFDWAEYIKGCIVKDLDMAKAVRRKGKNFKGCIAALLQWSFKNAKQVDKEICKLAMVPEKVTLGIPGMGTAKKIIREYYLGK